LPFRLGSGVRNLSHTEAHDLWVLLRAALAWLAVAVAAWVSLRRHRPSLLLLALALGSLAPVLLVKHIPVPGVEGKYALADRWLALAVAATAILYALHAERLANPRLRRFLVAVCAAWCVGSLAISQHAHAAYANETALRDLEDDSYAATPERYRTFEERCRYAQRLIAREAQSGQLDRVAQMTKELPTGCNSDAESAFNQLATVARGGRWAEARPLVDRLLGANVPPRFRADLLYLCGRTLLETGEPQRAALLFEQSLQLGLANCNAHIGLAKALAAQGRTVEANQRAAEAKRCLGAR
jgi:hypothetical protein